MTAASRSFPNPQPFVESIEDQALESVRTLRTQRRAMLLWDSGLITVAEFNQIMNGVVHPDAFSGVPQRNGNVPERNAHARGRTLRPRRSQKFSTKRNWRHE